MEGYIQLVFLKESFNSLTKQPYNGGEMAQQTLVFPSAIGILLLVIVILSFIVANLWKRGKTVEAILVVNALLQIITIVILLFK